MSNFITRQAQGRRATHVPEQQQAEVLSWRLSLYSEPPRTVITIEDFERYAIDRLRGGYNPGGVLMPHAFMNCCLIIAGRYCQYVLTSLPVVLRGIEDFRAKGFKPSAVQDEARKLADKHLKVVTLTSHHNLCTAPLTCIDPLCIKSQERMESCLNKADHAGLHSVNALLALDANN